MNRPYFEDTVFFIPVFVNQPQNPLLSVCGVDSLAEILI